MRRTPLTPDNGIEIPRHHAEGAFLFFGAPHSPRITGLKLVAVRFHELVVTEAHPTHPG